ncbi:putative aflatoxin b1 aldehyde reductase-like protein [Amylocarpus encephaloides]|uniref:Aflatoxin b1 aldehyde reductase-like protein n=1 Tax=Amylocarpus encephaloides TaxID=45428 RepID=A0A9P8C5R7_9HELO|nr:putative aflatoxin b1 aldehyde reductase-like protein [Amylocarpus encephaloides]
MSLLTGTGKPRVILGLMTFGEREEAVSAGARITTLEGYTQVLDHLQGAGYNEVDTARAYIDGKQEAFTKKAQWKERGLTLATKVYPRTPGIHKPDVITEQFEISLKELGTDCVDIFYLHAADRSVPFTETLAAVDKLHKQKKFVQLGLSNFTAFEVAEIVMHCKYNNWVRPTIYQGMYNAITRSLEKELIPACKRYGIDVVVYNPLAGGLFSGKYKTSEIPTEGRFSDSTTSMGAMYRARYYKDSTFEALSVIEPVVVKLGLTMVEVALRWVVNHSALNVKDGNDGVIIGVSSLQQLDENLKGCEAGPLPDEVVEALDKAWKISQPDTPNYWHMDLKYTYDTRKALFNV